ncbi:MAG: TetR/AcrR family transcriptional regulator [Clostridiales bacterium]|nr:TetR/AcrR family transcriptional regulator [Clostridiales bacterium]
MPLQLYEKEEILDSCFKIFVKKGYSKTTTAMLSEAAGVSKALLFHHFKSKKKIYISVLERSFDKMSKEFVEEPITDFNDFFEAKGQSGLNKISYLRQNPDLSKLLYEAYMDTPDELRDEIYKFVIYIKNKYKSIDTSKNELMKTLFDEIPLRDGVESEQAYELVKMVDDHFRKKIATELTDDTKLQDDEYWEKLIFRKRKFLDMVRYGIEKKGG